MLKLGLQGSNAQNWGFGRQLNHDRVNGWIPSSISYLLIGGQNLRKSDLTCRKEVTGNIPFKDLFCPWSF